MLQLDILNVKIWYDPQDSWLFENWVGQHLYSTLWEWLWVKTPNYTSCPVSQRCCALQIHITWCRATMSACRRLIWGKAMEFISYLLTWERSVWWSVTSCQPTIYHQFSAQPKIRICELSREIQFINIISSLLYLLT